MKFWTSLWTLLMVILFSCKTTLPQRPKPVAPTPVTEAVSESVNLAAYRAVGTPLAKDDLCAALSDDEAFPEELVAQQLRWFCGRDGFETLRRSSWSGDGEIKVREYFSEHDKTVYYAGALVVRGNSNQSELGGPMFCHDLDAYRAKVADKGFEGVKSIQVVSKTSDSCEYMVRSGGDWGVSLDMKVERSYGYLRESAAHWRVESLVTPLNYSAVSQMSGLFLSWQEADGVHSVYLLRAQSRLGGIHMNTARTKWKTAVTGTIAATAALIKN